MNQKKMQMKVHQIQVTLHINNTWRTQTTANVDFLQITDTQNLYM